MPAVTVSDTGQVWTRIGITADSSTTTLTIDPKTPTTLYAGTEEGVLKSTDGGRTWRVFNSGLRLSDQVDALAIAYTTPSTVYAGSSYVYVTR